MDEHAGEDERRAFRRRLLKWYRANARDLPWRRTGDPYRIWLSEIMLQQTTVAAVIPYYERFTAAYPDVASLAASEEEDVLRLWEGLGYYSRARNLRRAAAEVVDRSGGEFPRTLEDVQSLPGVGRYTAGAVVSFAYDRPAPIVEANTQRLYARLLALDADLTTAAAKDRLWAFAESVLPRRSAGAVNQALMELGSQVCRPKEPDCGACPVSDHCAALAAGRVAEIPRPKKRPEVTELIEACVAVRDGDAYLIRQRQEGEWWAGLWDFVRVPVAASLVSAVPDGRGPVLPGVFGPVEAAVRGAAGVEVSVDEWLREIRHGVTRYRIRLLCFSATRVRGKPTGEARWATAAELAEVPLTKTARVVAGIL